MPFGPYLSGWSSSNLNKPIPRWDCLDLRCAPRVSCAEVVHPPNAPFKLDEGGTMWTKEPQTEQPGSASSRESRFPGAPLSATASIRPSSPTARDLSCLGSTLEIKGEISGDEDLQIDGKIEGPISLPGHRVTIGRTAQLSSQVTAREVIVYGTATGDLSVRDRVEIKKDAEVMGDITTARISVEDGASFKGRIEIESKKPPVQPDPEATEVPVG